MEPKAPVTLVTRIFFAQLLFHLHGGTARLVVSEEPPADQPTYTVIGLSGQAAMAPPADQPHQQDGGMVNNANYILRRLHFIIWFSSLVWIEFSGKTEPG